MISIDVESKNCQNSPAEVLSEILLVILITEKVNDIYSPSPADMYCFYIYTYIYVYNSTAGRCM